jgi:hypothetical protein
MRRHSSFYFLLRAVFVIGGGCVFCEVGTDAKETLNVCSLTVNLDTRVYKTRCLSFFDVHVVMDCRSVARKRSRISLLCVL